MLYANPSWPDMSLYFILHNIIISAANWLL